MNFAFNENSYSKREDWEIEYWPMNIRKVKGELCTQGDGHARDLDVK